MDLRPVGFPTPPPLLVWGPAAGQAGHGKSKDWAYLGELPTGRRQPVGRCRQVLTENKTE